MVPFGCLRRTVAVPSPVPPCLVETRSPSICSMLVSASPYVLSTVMNRAAGGPERIPDAHFEPPLALRLLGDGLRGVLQQIADHGA